MQKKFLITLSILFGILLFLPVIVLSQTPEKIIGSSNIITTKYVEKKIGILGTPVIEYGTGIYWDSACTNRIEEIDWGTLYPGSVANKDIYIRNEGSQAGTFYMVTRNWNPANTVNYLHLTWNYSEQPVNPNQVIPIKITLKVDSDISNITNFAFDIIFGDPAIVNETCVLNTECNGKFPYQRWCDGQKLKKCDSDCQFSQKCESGCGADPECDEVAPGTNYCDNNCRYKPCFGMNTESCGFWDCVFGKVCCKWVGALTCGPKPCSELFSDECVSCRGCSLSAYADCELEGGECMMGSGGCSVMCKRMGYKMGICEMGLPNVGYYPGCGERDCCCLCFGEITTTTNPRAQTTTPNVGGEGPVVTTTTIREIKGYNVRTVYLKLFANSFIVIVIVVIMIGILFGTFRIIVKKK